MLHSCQTEKMSSEEKENNITKGSSSFHPQNFQISYFYTQGKIRNHSMPPKLTRVIESSNDQIWLKSLAFGDGKLLKINH